MVSHPQFGRYNLSSLSTVKQHVLGRPVTVLGLGPIFCISEASALLQTFEIWWFGKNPLVPEDSRTVITSSLIDSTSTLLLSLVTMFNNYSYNFWEFFLSFSGTWSTLDSLLFSQVGGRTFSFVLVSKNKEHLALGRSRWTEYGKARPGFSRVSSSERTASISYKAPECCWFNPDC